MLAPHASVSEIPSDLGNPSWAHPGAGAGASPLKAAIQSDTISLIPLLVQLSWLFDVQSDEVSAMTRVMVAVQSWLPSRKVATEISSLTTDSGLGEENTYRLISPREGLRVGYTGSFWREGWTALHLPNWVRFLLLSHALSKREFGHFPDLGGALTPDTLAREERASGKESTSLPRRTLPLPGRKVSSIDTPEKELLNSYEIWLSTRRGKSGDAMTIGNLRRLTRLFVAANILRTIQGRARLQNGSLPYRALISNGKCFRFLISLR